MLFRPQKGPLGKSPIATLLSLGVGRGDDLVNASLSLGVGQGQ